MSEEGGQATESWMDGIQSDELKGSDALKQFESLDTLAQGYLDLKTYQGQSIRIPGDDASDEMRAEFNAKLLEKVPGLMNKPDFENAEQSHEFYRQIGMPEEAKDYGFPEIEGLEVDNERKEFLQGVAHEVGISKNQFNGLMQKALEHDAQLAQANKEAHTDEMNALQSEWGHAFKERMDAAEAVRKTFFDFIPAEELGTETLKAFHALSQQLGKEAVNLAGQQQQQSSTMTPDDARAQIAEINRNKEHPYWNASDPGHKEAVDRMVKLMGYANPQASTNINDLRAGGMGGMS